jgi:DNA-directed RNA polymerase specialized sigma24 family protein
MDNPVVEATLDWAILTGLEWIQDGRAQGMGEFRSFRLARAALRFGHDMLRHEHTGWHTCHVAASEGMDSEDRESEPDPVLIDAVAMLRLQRGCLTPRQDEAVRLCYEEGLTEAEAARALGVARSSLRGILDRAYSNLREPWGDRVPLWLE